MNDRAKVFFWVRGTAGDSRKRVGGIISVENIPDAIAVFLPDCCAERGASNESWVVTDKDGKVTRCADEETLLCFAVNYGANGSFLSRDEDAIIDLLKKTGYDGVKYKVRDELGGDFPRVSAFLNGVA